jgi:GNAT superfamily N-acetyltransferase
MQRLRGVPELAAGQQETTFTRQERRVEGLPHYRLDFLDEASLDAAIAALPASCIASATIRGTDVEAARALDARGFRKVCVLGLFARRIPPERPSVAAPPQPVRSADIPHLREHAANFRFCEYHFDGRITDAGWIEQNLGCILRMLSRPDIVCFRKQSGFACVRAAGEKAVVEILSVLRQRQGTGTALMAMVLAWAAAQGLRWVETATECENVPACLFYQKCGFRLGASLAAYHLMLPARPATR